MSSERYAKWSLDRRRPFFQQNKMFDRLQAVLGRQQMRAVRAGLVLCAAVLAGCDEPLQLSVDAQQATLDDGGSAAAGLITGDKLPTGDEPALLEKQIASFCGDCHALPRPESFVKDAWYEGIRTGYEMYARSGRQDLTPPRPVDVLRYYRERAPAAISFPDPPPVDETWRERFRIEKIDWKDKEYVKPGVASIRWLPLMKPDQHALVVCDMRDGSVSLLDPTIAGTKRKVLARLQNPCRVDPCDIDADGFQDLLVADLGSFLPYDHQHGRVVLLRRDPNGDAFAEIVVATAHGRVADVQAADFSGQGQPDILFAEFGHRQRGGIHLITNMAEPNQSPRLLTRTLDTRPGAVQLPPHDWNNDGRLDVTAVISQEYESVEIFLNRGERFERHTIWQGPDLSFGSVGLTLTDLDGDQDTDILYVNGDSFDNTFANLSHGVQWLENLGDMQFKYHRIANVPCAYRAVAHDMDADGDKDIVLVVNMPWNVKPLSLRRSNPASILLLEQTQSASFVIHVLERGSPNYPALEVGDFNGDGAPDFVVGALVFEETPQPLPPRLAIWWGKSPSFQQPLE